MSLTTVGAVGLDVLPTAGKFAASLRKELASVESQLAGTTSKSGGNIGSKFGSAFVGTMKKVTKAGLAGGALFAGLAIKGGFSRLMQIDDARASLKGLGHDSKAVNKIMGNALNSVKGTAFGMGEAASTAASAVAANVKPGKDLERTLSLVADAATIAKTDMGSMGAIFNKVAASNKVQMDSINQLHDAGVPALQFLAKELGVTAEEASKMASAGQIDFATFQNAMETGLGGAAKESGNTLRGSFKNTLASISRVGANLLSKVFPMFTTGFQNLSKWLGPIEEKATKLGDAFGSWLKSNGPQILDKVSDAASALKTPLSVVWEVLKGVGSWMLDNKKTVGIFAGVVLGLAAGLAIVTAATAAWSAVLAVSPITWIVLGIAAIAAGVYYAYTHFSTFRTVVQKAFAAIQTVVSVAWNNFLKPIFTALWTFISGTLIPTFQYLWTSVLQPIFSAFGTLVSFVWNSLIRPAFSALVSFMTNVVGPAFSLLWTILQPIMWLIGKHISMIWNVFIKPALNALKWALTNVLIPAFQKILSVAKPVFGIIGSAISTGWAVMDTAFKKIKSGLDTVKSAFTTAKDTIGTQWDKIKSKIKTPLKWVIDNVVNKLVDGVNKLIPGSGPLSRISTKGWREGGYTGNLNKNAVAGVVHGDEHVIRSESRRRIEREHPGLLDYLNSRGEMPAGYKKGGRVYPVKGSKKWTTYAGHTGIDFPRAMGTGVYASTAGKVSSTPKLAGSYGHHINLSGDGYRQIYAHLSKFAVKAGQKVAAGQRIGSVGSTGNSTGPHLHFEVRPGGNSSSASRFLSGAGAPSGKKAEEKSSMFKWLADRFNFKKKLTGWLKGVDAKSGIFGSGLKGFAKNQATGVWNGIKSTLGDLKDYAKAIPGKIFKKLNPFDTGGIASGKGFMLKNTNEPERVLSPRQTLAFEKALSQNFDGSNSRGRSADRLEFVITNWNTGEGYLRSIAEDVVDANSELLATTGRM